MGRQRATPIRKAAGSDDAPQQRRPRHPRGTQQRMRKETTMFVQAWTTREIEALEAIALPTREAFRGDNIQSGIVYANHVLSAPRNPTCATFVAGVLRQAA